MSIDDRIEEAFARHETDVRPSPGAWTEVERRIGRSHRRRVVASALGATLGLAALALLGPRIVDDRPTPVATEDWKTISSDGFTISYPRDWTAEAITDSANQVHLFPPGPPRDSKGDISFTVNAILWNGPYDEGLRTPGAPWFLAQPPFNHIATPTRGELAGRPYVRWASATQTAFPSGSKVTDDTPPNRIIYSIDWPGSPPCTGKAACSLVVDITASSSAVLEEYLPTAERIVRTIRPVPTPTERSAQPRLLTKIPAPAFRLAAGPDAMWGLVGNPRPRERGTLLRIDAATNRVTARVPVGINPISVAADDAAVWVTNNDGCTELCEDYETGPIPRNSLTRFDPRTGRMVATMRVDLRPQDVEAVFGAVWVTAAGKLEAKGTQLLRIDPATNQIVATIKLGTTDTFAEIDYADGYLWVLNPLESGDFQVVRVDPQTNAIKRFGTVAGSSAHSALAVGSGSIWVTTTGKDSASGLERIDPSTGRTITRITLPDAAPVGLIAATTGEGFVWATSTRGFLWKVDPATNKPAGDPVLIGDTPPVDAPDVVTGFGSVWVCSGDGKIWRFVP